MTTPVVRLHPQRHKRVANGHPWVFSNEIVMDEAAKALPNGSVVLFSAHDGAPLGVGTFNAHSLIAGRIFSRQAVITLDADFFRARLTAALTLRDRLVDAPYYRLVHAEADGLPGLIVDRFGDALGVQVNTAGMQLLWPEVRAALIDLLNPKLIVLHNDSPARTMEGLSPSVSIDLGAADGPVPVAENGLTYFADLAGGQKTGWYFDQRDNHALMARFAKGKTFLDLFCHAGGFGLLAAKAGAKQVVGVDSSKPALDLAEKGALHNKLGKVCSWTKADVFDDLAQRIAAHEAYDIVVADPPPFVRSKKDLASGSRAYRKLARLSATVTRPGGFLYIASCSHNMELAAFTTEVARGLGDAKRVGRILYTVSAAPDHPVHPALPESAYLKGLVIEVD